MRKIAAALFMALIAGPALAQDHVQKYREEEKEKTQTQKDADKQAERAYQRSLNSVPDQKSNDPWGIARSDSAAPGAPKAAAKPAAKTAAPKQAKPAGAATN